jgi:hypothetical protein
VIGTRLADVVLLAEGLAQLLEGLGVRRASLLGSSLGDRRIILVTARPARTGLVGKAASPSAQGRLLARLLGLPFR